MEGQGDDRGILFGDVAQPFLRISLSCNTSTGNTRTESREQVSFSHQSLFRRHDLAKTLSLLKAQNIPLLGWSHTHFLPCTHHVWVLIHALRFQMLINRLCLSCGLVFLDT
jgi:hypothetical protein